MTADQQPSSPQNSGVGVSVRPSHRSYRAYVRQQQNLVVKEEDLGSPRLWRQMTCGFVCAACVGLCMLTVGSVFIAEAIHSKYSITIMLCVMGMVCGLIILVGTLILGKLWISRKWRIAHGQQPSQHPPQQCFHTCSVINTPSQDQLAYTSDPPPAYETIMMTDLPPGVISPVHPPDTEPSTSQGVTRYQVKAVMALPPKYSDVAAPLPSYGEQV
ncbi:uncharacterized protein LOC110464196 [Mizuhopecten yessoensis]|uniref:Uncharacterized protein n=1 Tax=Mizuhopecten yessoensis TaxID=6573 RepID=A0A210PUF2_MIZYE|nr:uncharacterized protein LOC110464196 [Mizuhopecten yessoensis]XP_021374958.1 uncharacterized protein LOC110464196 [Mizuhopecten yessoensis]OWF40129.1 hypothetical protein KP79_PYT05903 [Mizuhopecten yessoensis]